jgi:hypothetical protein
VTSTSTISGINILARLAAQCSKSWGRDSKNPWIAVIIARSVGGPGSCSDRLRCSIDLTAFRGRQRPFSTQSAQTPGACASRSRLWIKSSIQTRDLGYIQYRETGAVVLESKPFARAPHRDQIVEVLDVRSSRNGQPQKADITPFAGSREHEDRRDRPPSGLAGVKAVEEAPEQFVAETTCFVETVAGLLVVAIVDECPALPVESVGPIRVVK